MKNHFLTALAASTIFITGGALAQSSSNPIKIGFITTLTTPSGYLGQEIRDAFALAMEQEGGKLGGQQVELMVVDDGLKPDVAKQTAERMFERDGVRIFSGIVFSNIAAAVVPDLVSNGALYISPNASPNEMAGASCHKNYFVASWQAGTQSEMAGILANQLNYKNVLLLAPNYVAGLDQIASFKRHYKGNISTEILTKLGQTDYSAEITRIRAAKPDAVFFFLPGGMGISFIKSLKDSGLGSMPLVTPLTVDERIVDALGEKAQGIRGTTFWNYDFENSSNRIFVEQFRKKYGKIPSTYAAQGYDTARLIASALRAVGGDVSKVDQFRAALKAAKFDSIRGKFGFANNNHPIQDWYSREVVKDSSGNYVMKTTGVLAKDHTDVYAKECKL